MLFIGGVLGLGLLVVFHVRSLLNAPPVPLSKAPIEVPAEFAKAPFYAKDGCFFTVNRKNRTVVAIEEETGNTRWESHGEKAFIVPGQSFPLDLSDEGELWVANVGKKRLERLDPKTGAYIASWEPKEPFAGCCNPVRFAALSRGRFVTMEKGTGRVSIYKPSGELEKTVSTQLSKSEDNYYLYRAEGKVHIFDRGSSLRLEVPCD